MFALNEVGRRKESEGLKSSFIERSTDGRVGDSLGIRDPRTRLRRAFLGALGLSRSLVLR